MKPYSPGSGRPEPLSNSFVLNWVESRRKELRSENAITVEAMFASFMYCVSRFATVGRAEREATEETQLFEDLQQQFANDAALFELGCYACFLVDLWLSQNRPYLRQMISGGFRHQFNQLFAEALQMKDIAELFAQRVEGYRELAASEAALKRRHFYLSQLIIRVQDNVKPGRYEFDNEPIMITGGVFKYALDAKLGLWEASMLPALIEMIEKSTDLIE